MNLLEIGVKPDSRFSRADVLACLRLIDNHAPIGRKKLGEKIGIGEGSVRSILTILKGENYVSSTPRGHVLTDKGKHRLGDIERKLVQLDAGGITVGGTDAAVIVEGASYLVDNGVSVRDEAIKAGAEGATTLIFENGDFEFPGMKLDLKSKIKRKLEEEFRLEDGDVIIIGSGDDRVDAEKGALAGADYLLDCKA